MPYSITLSNGSLLTTIADDTLDNSTSLTLLGRNYIGYGSIVAENFVHQLENFASTTPPSSPLTGQLWYNTSLSTLELWNGTSWGAVAAESSGITITDTTAANTGLVFYDPLGPLNGKYFRLRVRDDGLYAGNFVLESLNDDLSLNTVILSTSNVGNGSILVDASVPEVATDSALPTVTTAPLSTYLVQNWAVNNLPALAGRDLINNKWRFYPTANTAPASALTVTGATHTYAISDPSPFLVRSNGGAPMIDVLPGTSPGILPVGWKRTIYNGDSAGMIALTAGAGTLIAGNVATTIAYIGPRQSVEIYCDGTLYYFMPHANRALMGSNLNLYVSTTGSDSHNGLTTGTALATLQYAAQLAFSFDTAGADVIVNVAAGSYTAGSTLGGPLFGGGRLHYLGNTTSPSTVNLTLGAAGACFLSSNGYMLVSGFTLSAPVGSAGNPGYCLGAQLGGILVYDHVTFNPAQYCHMATGEAGYMAAQGPYTIAGGAQYHMVAGSTGSSNVVDSETVTLSGTPNFSGAFAWADSSSLAFVPANTYVGSATGARYLCTNGGFVDTGAGGSTYLPGSVGGTNVNGYFS